MINDVAREGGAQGSANSNCAPDNPQSKVEAAGAAKHKYSKGRRPQESARRPTLGANPATTSCGTTIHAPIQVEAHSLDRMVNMLPMSGSMAAFATWNSKTQAAKTSKRRVLRR